MIFNVLECKFSLNVYGLFIKDYLLMNFNPTFKTEIIRNTINS